MSMISLINTFFSAATSTVKEEIVRTYQNSQIPMRNEQNMTLDIIKLYEQMKDLLKISKEQRESGRPKERIEAVKDSLNHTMLFWPKIFLK